jgi:peptidoglycan hydrolase-like protein with peptidoglycan-binding domain
MNKIRLFATITSAALFALPTFAFASFDQDLRQGDSGQSVTEMQTFLAGQGDFSITPTGTFGSITRAAVQSFQQRHGIFPAAGFWGPRTRGVGNNLFNGSNGTIGVNSGSGNGSNYSAQYNSSQNAAIQSLLAMIQQLQAQIGTLTSAQTSSSISMATSNTSNVSCTWNGGTILSGTSVTAYQSASVAAGQSCQSEMRTCTNGTLSGTNTYATCSVTSTSSLNTAGTTGSTCAWNGQIIANGSTVTSYLGSSALPNIGCKDTTRRCVNGILTGAGRFAACTIVSATSTATVPAVVWGEKDPMPDGLVFTGKWYVNAASGVAINKLTCDSDMACPLQTAIRKPLIPGIDTNSGSILYRETSPDYIPCPSGVLNSDKSAQQQLKCGAFSPGYDPNNYWAIYRRNSPGVGTHTIKFGDAGTPYEISVAGTVGICGQGSPYQFHYETPVEETAYKLSSGTGLAYPYACLDAGDSSASGSYSLSCWLTSDDPTNTWGSGSWSNADDINVQLAATGAIHATGGMCK